MRFDGLGHDFVGVFENAAHRSTGAEIERGTLDQTVRDVDGGAVLDEADSALDAVGHDRMVQRCATIVGLRIDLRPAIQKNLIRVGEKGEHPHRWVNEWDTEAGAGIL